MLFSQRKKTFLSIILLIIFGLPVMTSHFSGKLFSEQSATTKLISPRSSYYRFHNANVLADFDKLISDGESYSFSQEIQEGYYYILRYSCSIRLADVTCFIDGELVEGKKKEWIALSNKTIEIVTNVDGFSENVEFYLAECHPDFIFDTDQPEISSESFGDGYTIPTVDFPDLFYNGSVIANEILNLTIDKGKLFYIFWKSSCSDSKQYLQKISLYVDGQILGLGLASAYDGISMSKAFFDKDIQISVSYPMGTANEENEVASLLVYTCDDYIYNRQYNQTIFGPDWLQNYDEELSKSEVQDNITLTKEDSIHIEVGIAFRISDPYSIGTYIEVIHESGWVIARQEVSIGSSYAEYTQEYFDLPRLPAGTYKLRSSNSRFKIKMFSKSQAGEGGVISGFSLEIFMSISLLGILSIIINSKHRKQ